MRNRDEASYNPIEIQVYVPNNIRKALRILLVEEGYTWCTSRLTVHRGVYAI